MSLPKPKIWPGAGSITRMLAVLNYWVLGISKTKSDADNKASSIDSRAPVPSSRQARRRIGQRLEADETRGIGIL
jgi:hypothetical protein